MGETVSFLRAPDAGNPHVRCDEREQETELCPTGLRRRGESLANRHRETNATAPVLDSTKNYTLQNPGPCRSPSFAGSEGSLPPFGVPAGLVTSPAGPLEPALGALGDRSEAEGFRLRAAAHARGRSYKTEQGIHRDRPESLSLPGVRRAQQAQLQGPRGESGRQHALAPSASQGTHRCGAPEERRE